MSLNQLVSYIRKKETEFEDHVRQEKKRLQEAISQEYRKLRLKLQFIFEEIDITRDLWRYGEFEDGNEFKFNLRQGHLTVLIDPNRLILKSGEMEIAKFDGRRVKAEYRRMVKAINQAREEGMYEPPF